MKNKNKAMRYTLSLPWAEVFRRKPGPRATAETGVVFLWNQNDPTARGADREGKEGQRTREPYPYF